jgi:MFS family permease
MDSSLLSVIRTTHFRRLWLAQISSQIALNMLTFVLAIRVYEQTHSNAAVSLMLLTFGIPAIFFGIIAGGIVDHYDKRKILLFCNTSRVLLFLLYYIFSANLIVLFILTVLISIITQLFIPSEAPAIPAVVTPKQILAANSLFTISYYACTIGGFIAAGPAIRIFGARPVFLVMALLMTIASYYVYLLPPISAIKRTKGAVFSLRFIKKTLHEGISFISSNKRIKDSLILMTFSQALIATLSVLAPGFADKILGIDLTDASYMVMGPAALGLVLGAVLVGSIGMKFLKGKIILFGLFTTGLVLLGLSMITHGALSFFGLTLPTNTVLYAVVLLFLLGVCNTLISVPANTILQEDSTEEMRGRVYGVLTSLTGGISLLPVVFSGVLADIAGVGKSLFVLGCIISTIGAYQYIRNSR